MIQGQKTKLRAIEREDLPTFVRWFNDPEVRQYLRIVYQDVGHSGSHLGDDRFQQVMGERASQLDLLQFEGNGFSLEGANPDRQIPFAIYIF